MGEIKTAILIKKAALVFDKIANEETAKHNLTPAQFRVLKYIFLEEENGVRITDLEKYYSISHPTTIGIVKNLKKKGLVDYKQNPHDGRSRYIVATPLALKEKDELVALGDTLENDLTHLLTESEKKHLSTLLEKMLGLDQEEKND